MITLIASFLALGIQLDLRPVELHGKFFVLAPEGEANGKVMFPLPRDYRGQTPVGFQLKIKPELAVKSKSVRVTATGDYVLELECAPMAVGKRFEVDWRSQLIVDMRETSRIPDIKEAPEMHERVKAWLRPSRYVQSDHPDIIKQAQSVKADSYSGKIYQTFLLQQRIINAQRGQATELSSLTALTLKGTCTSEANLLAALLRANGVPARLVSGYPTYANRPYDTHYIVEAYCGEASWLPVEPGMTSSMVPVVSVISVENENLGERRISAAEGVPYLSLTETTGRLVARGLLNSKYSEHEAKLNLKISLKPESLLPAKARWKEWLSTVVKSYEDLPVVFEKK